PHSASAGARWWRKITLANLAGAARTSSGRNPEKETRDEDRSEAWVGRGAAAGTARGPGAVERARAGARPAGDRSRRAGAERRRHVRVGGRAVRRRRGRRVRPRRGRPRRGAAR